MGEQQKIKERLSEISESVSYDVGRDIFLVTLSYKGREKLVKIQQTVIGWVEDLYEIGPTNLNDLLYRLNHKFKTRANLDNLNHPFEQTTKR